MWGVVAEGDESTGRLLAYHVVPLIQLDTALDPAPSAAHLLTPSCPCHPTPDGVNEHDGTPIWNHHDPDHPGSLEREAAAAREPA